MKRKALTLAILVVCMLTILTGCSNKTPTTADSFVEKAEQEGYVIIDAMDQIEEGLVEAYKIALTDDCKMEFFIVPTEEQAKKAFNDNKETFESYKDASSISSSVSAANYSRYSLTADGEFYMVSRIGNTVMFVRAMVDVKEEVIEFAKELGYL